MPVHFSLPATLRRWALVLSACSVTLTAQADEPRERWHQDIAIGYGRLASESADLADTAQRYCEAPDQGLRRQLEERWQAAFLAWQRIRFVEFGPIEQDSLAWQFQFWPDPKNLVARKVDYWINDDNELNEETLIAAGVAAQGYPAVEYLLWDSRFLLSEQALPTLRSCQFLVALTSHIRTNTETLHTNWQTFRDHYQTRDSYTATTIRSAMNAVEVMQDRRLGAPMGLRGSDRRNPYQADAWRSETSLATIRASIEGLRDHFLPGLALELADHPELNAGLAAQVTEVLGDLANLPDGMAPLLADDEGFGKLQSLYIDVVQLEQTLNDDIAAALGIARGFNSSDGD